MLVRFTNFSMVVRPLYLLFFIGFSTVVFSCKNQQTTTKNKTLNNEVVELDAKEIAGKNSIAHNQKCITASKKANERGLKIWCWHDTEITETRNSATNFFSSYHLAVNSHCNNGMVTSVDDRLYFKVNPTSPTAQDWCKYDYNYRAEIRENPSDVNHPVGTEQWFGWNYKFGEDYKADPSSEWIMWQVHGSFNSPPNPLISLWVSKTNFAKHTNEAGEIFVTNAAINSKKHKYTPTGITPIAGQSLDIVVHVIWGDEHSGLYEVWIDGKPVYSEKERTVYIEQPEGGYAKWGIYKWNWQNESRVLASAAAGISELNTSMGPLRVLMNRQGDLEYGKNVYDLVAPK